MPSRSLLLLLSLGCAAPAQTPRVNFSRDIAPIFARSCGACHGDSQQLSGFSLLTRESALRGGAHGPAIVAGKSADSPLVKRLQGDLEPSMPLGGKLADTEIAAIRQWIDQGAAWDATTTTSAASVPAAMKITASDRNWWAFRPPVRSEAPATIDAFVFAKLREKDLTPSPKASKNTLIRRAFLDLTGLPPTPVEVDAFVRDDSSDAFAKLVDRLLASPHYGERWGRHWLDVARYADSGGYEQDFTYPNAWRYRDYVIRAFNQDKPYDRFIREQVAGDELDDADYDALIATGFHRVGATVGFREKDNPQYRFTYLDDLIGTTTRAFLGLTVSCARCHDHKFDPIPQMDYYKLMAVFNPYINYDHPLAPKEEVNAYQRRKAAVEAMTTPLKERIASLEEPYRKRAFEAKLATFPADIQLAVRTPEDQRTEGQKLLATQVLSIRASNFRGLMTAADRATLETLSRQVKDFEKDLPAPLPVAMGIRDGDYRLAPMGPGDDEAPGKAGSGHHEDTNETYIPVAGKPYRPPKSHFHDHGDPESPGAIVEPGFLEILGLDTLVSIAPKDGRITTGRRRALAEWIARPDNPLTARVMVNRIWQHHFGRGIVATPSNFGRLGRRPSHPELLDWLATEFIRTGWSVKQIHRLIMNSETYQMASEYMSSAALEKDPDNVLLWHYPNRRLEGEAIRDSILAVSGNLNRKAGGPAYFPVVPEQVRKAVYKGIWVVNNDGPDVWRRGVYSYYKRGMKYPLFEVFDQPDPNVTCEGRGVTTVPTQALTLLNNEFVLTQARAFAQRILTAAGPEQEAQVRAAYRLSLSREPSPSELRASVEFLNRQLTAHRGSSIDALTDLCDVILNLNEFLYIN
ncbi:MAG: PSD1 and planctomycete cytochrome C domain-containing protein [Bryobacteraceae bacterium]